jgi:hypothetical protein
VAVHYHQAQGMDAVCPVTVHVNYHTDKDAQIARIYNELYARCVVTANRTACAPRTNATAEV